MEHQAEAATACGRLPRQELFGMGEAEPVLAELAVERGRDDLAELARCRFANVFLQGQRAFEITQPE
jgi:hypothetical protein